MKKLNMLQIIGGCRIIDSGALLASMVAKECGAIA
jgi:hypothetical protein